MPQNLVEEAVRSAILSRPVNKADPGAVEAAFVELCTLAQDGNTEARKIIDHSAKRLAKAVSVLTNALDFDRVIFGGPYWPLLSDAHLTLVPTALDTLTVAPHASAIRVEGTTFGTDVAAIGAACTVFENTISPNTRRLLLQH